MSYIGKHAPHSEAGRTARSMKPGDMVSGLTVAERGRLSVALYRIYGAGGHASSRMEDGTYSVWIPKEENQHV